MAVRFIIGRAGTGKTHRCLNAIRDCLRQDPINGPPLILLVPEQASLQMERSILQPAATSVPGEGIPAVHRAEVLSFRRLAYRVLESAGGPVPQTLSEPARAMVLRYLLVERSEQLQYYRRFARQGIARGRLGGFVEKLSATIAELIQEAIEPGQIAELTQCDDPGTRPVGEDPAGRAKLHDLHLIYQAYLDYLGADRLDPSQHLHVARERLPRCRWLEGALLWVDGFASLSGQEMLTLIALARLCQSIHITAMMDPSLSNASPSRPAGIWATGRLFSRICQTYQDLRDRFVRAGFEVEDPLFLDVPPPRFRANESLARLEQALFKAPPTPVSETETPLRNIKLVELPSRRIEVDYAVSQVCRWVQDPHTRYRYRDIAVIVRDLEPYHDLLGEALAARNIPFFIDRRRPVAHHPLVELLRAGTAMAAEAMSLESARLAIKTGLIPLSIEAADELENYLLAHGISGFDAWRAGQWSFRSLASLDDTIEQLDPYETEVIARINSTRGELVDCLEDWLTFASSRQGYTGAGWTSAISNWLDRLGVALTLRRWADDAEADGDLDQAEEHRQVWRDTMSVLDDLASAFADVKLTTGELADALEAGLSGLTLGLVPPMVDQLLVGSIERSRHPDIKAAVVLGFNDGVFPRQLVEDSILNDDDRSILHGAGIRVRPASRDRVVDESLLVYVALTRASEALVVTYAASDNNGKLLRPSPSVGALCGACPGLAPIRIGDPARLRETWDVLSQRDLTKRLAMEFRTRPVRDHDDLPVRGRWNELYDAIRAGLAGDDASRMAMVSLDEPRAARISPPVIERLHRGPLRTSVSELETYAACPFQHFARYVLRLRERAQATLEPVDVGQVHHAILEDFVGTLSTLGRGFDQLSESDLLDGLRESCAGVAARLSVGGALSDARSAYRLRRSASDLARVIQAQRRLAQSGSSRPRATELPFGFDEPGGLPAMELATPGGRRIVLRGYMDRVDLVELSDELLGIVIDYKRTPEKRLNLGEVYHGLSLQLLGYLLVLAENGQTLAGRPVRPIGALYVSLAPQYRRVDHPDLVSTRDQGLGGTYRPRGLLLSDDFDVLDRTLDPGRWSDAYSLYRKKDGEIGHIDESDAADAASFQALLDHVRLKLGQLADGILDGNVAVSPYRLGTFSPCTWCPMSAVCRFEMGISEIRFLDSLKRSEVFRRLAATQA